MAISLTKCAWALRAIIYKFRFGHIGKFGYIGKPVFLLGTRHVYLGNKVRIYPGVRFETYDGGEIHIEDGVSIGQNFHCTSAGKLSIGKNTTISGNTIVTNIDHEYREIGKHIMEQPLLVSDTEIGENCFIGYGVVIQAGTKLGKQCIVGANAVVRGEYPDYSVIAGVPAKKIKQYDVETERWK